MLREELQAQRTSLRRELEELGYGSEGLSYDPNFADSSQVTAERGESEALAANLTSNLVDVEHALGKMEAGTYGTCEACHGPSPRPAWRQCPPPGTASVARPSGGTRASTATKLCSFFTQSGPQATKCANTWFIAGCWHSPLGSKEGVKRWTGCS